MYTMRPTWPDKTSDYVFRYRGIDVGRTYAELIPGGMKWRWTIFIGLAFKRRIDGIPIAGFADTLEASKAAFKSSCERMIVAGAVRIEV